MKAVVAPLLVAAMLPFAAYAQDRPAPDPLRERNGPDAIPAPTPDYVTPAAGISLPAPPVPGAPAPKASSVGFTFSDVIVTGRADGVARPLPNWQPAADSASGVRLDDPGEHGFDAGWVRRQFVANGLIGTLTPLDRVTGLIQAINLAFVRNGFINSGVLLAGSPPVDGGTLTVELVYGHLVAAQAGGHPVTVTWGGGGAKGLTKGYIVKRLPAARTRPLNALTVERQFRALAEDPAIDTINADLRPGGVSGEAMLTLTVDPTPRSDLYATVANSRSPSIGGERAALGGSIRNLLVAGDITSGEAGVTAGRPDFLLGYQTPFLSPHTRLSLRGGYNDAAVVDAPLRPLDIKARDWNVAGGLAQTLLSRPLLPREGGGWQPAQSLSVGLLAAHRQTRTYLLGEPFSFSPGSVDGRAEYTALRLSAEWTRRGVREVFALSLTATQGIEGTRSDVPGAPSPDPGFRALLGQASYARRLDADGLELRLRLAGQYANGILYSGERLAAGGEYTVRGYRETLVLADTGAIGSVEMARPFSIGGNRRDARGVDWGAFSVSVFADGAAMHNRLDPQPVPRTLASVGASLAWIPSDAITARITYGKALKDAHYAGSRDLQDDGIEFRVTMRPLLLFRKPS